jgi:signal transduction histidine kinase
MSKIEKTLKIAFTLITLIFFSAGAVYFIRYQNQMSKDIYSEQEKVAKLTSNALSLYFDKLKFAIENTVSASSYEYLKNIQEDKIRFLPSNDLSLKPINEESNEVWNYFKGLPLEHNGKRIAEERRSLAKNIIKNYSDVHYVFEMDLNGDLVFLEPYETQKKITSFNYKFRDYLKLVKKSKTTSISEGYISHDKNRTHIITVATPIKNTAGEVKKVYAASISAKTLHDRVLKDIADQIDQEKNYKISLVDRHGHIVANSYDLENYSPTMDISNDNKDKGNIRNYGIFNDIEWSEDIFEKHNVWERKTKSWNLINNDIFTASYVSQNNVNVFGSLYPISIYKDSSYNWGVLVETSKEAYTKENQLTLLGFFVSFIIIVSLLYLVYKRALREYRSIESDVKRAESNLKQLARKVRHDIRSPLTSMEYLFESIKPKLEEEERLIGSHSLERINDIVLTLSPEQAVSVDIRDNSGVEILFPLINRVISEKRIEFKATEGILIKLQNNLEYGVFAKINKSDLARTISNLINNSAEAKRVDGPLLINVRLASDAESCYIEIQDNGIGIQESKLKKVLEYGVSHNKNSGKGIGLSQAKDHVEKANGKFDIKSTVDIGTTIRITLPREIEPEWFKSQLYFLSKHLCIVDDDESIHLLWAKKLAPYNLNIVNIKSSNEFTQWASGINLSDYYFLFDLELLGSDLTGLDLIKKFELSGHSSLVTSHYNDPEIQNASTDIGIQIVPKDSASDVPLVIQSNSQSNVVLIDDDQLVHMVWKRQLREQGIGLSSYYAIEDFLMSSSKFDPNTPIYIDSNLGDGVKGEVESKKIFEMGFENLHLATGQSVEEIDVPFWIKSVQGKMLHV